MDSQIVKHEENKWGNKLSTVSACLRCMHALGAVLGWRRRSRSAAAAVPLPLPLLRASPLAASPRTRPYIKLLANALWSHRS